MFEKLENYLPALVEEFMMKGIKSLTMDDIAKKLGVSKKTIYTLVDDKGDLVKKTLLYFLSFEQERVNEITQKEENAIDQLIQINRFVIESIKSIHPSIIFDLQKYYPESYKVLEEHKHDFIYNVMVDNMILGKKQKLYRESINEAILAKVYVVRVDSLLTETILNNQFDFNEVYTEISKYHLYGIASFEGVKYMNNKYNKDPFN